MGRHSGSSTVAIAGLVFGVVGGILLTVFGWGVPTDYRIDQSGATATGVVERVTVDPTRRKYRVPMTRLDYRFAIDGREYRGEHWTIDEAFLERHPVGATPTIELNGADPSESRLAGTRLATFGPWGLLTGLWPALGVGLLVFAFVLFLRERAPRRR